MHYLANMSDVAGSLRRYATGNHRKLSANSRVFSRITPAYPRIHPRTLANSRELSRICSRTLAYSSRTFANFANSRVFVAYPRIRRVFAYLSRTVANFRELSRIRHELGRELRVFVANSRVSARVFSRIRRELSRIRRELSHICCKLSRTLAYFRCIRLTTPLRHPWSSART